MQQYFAIHREKNILHLNKDDFNHIKNVMRMKENDKVIVAFEGNSYICSLRSDLISCNIDEIFKSDESDNTIIAYIPLLQEEKIDLVLQKGTELGISEFVVVEYERCKYKLPKKNYEKKLLRWNKIIKEASEQCYRTKKPVIEKIITVDDILLNTNVNILCSLVKNGVKHISAILNSDTCNDTIGIAFGPEGGFSEKEEELLIKKGFRRATLGPNVLRTETVLIYLGSVLMYLKGSVKWKK